VAGANDARRQKNNGTYRTDSPLTCGECRGRGVRLASELLEEVHGEACGLIRPWPSESIGEEVHGVAGQHFEGRLKRVPF
jgi:hypothetical protein